MNLRDKIILTVNGLVLLGGVFFFMLFLSFPETRETIREDHSKSFLLSLICFGPFWISTLIGNGSGGYPQKVPNF